MRRETSLAGNLLTRAVLALAGLAVVVLALAGAIDSEIAALHTARADKLRAAETAAAALTMLTGSWLLLVTAYGRRRRPPSDARVEQLEQEARTDNLTRLGNHRGFHHDLTEAIRSRASTGTVLTLMAIDLDGLKQINDTHGHPAGDAHIRKVAACLQRTVAGAGTVYRTGGDEFMVLLPGRRNWHGLTLAHQIDHATRLATGRRAVSIGLTESLGTEGRHLLVHQADVALYEAKRTKLSAVAFHEGLSSLDGGSELGDGPSHEQRALAAALARAVDAKDSGTRSHSEVVAQLCVAIGERLDVDPVSLERLRMAGLLHDVGKIGVADAILQKPSALDPDEAKAMAEHVPVGHAILIAAEMPTEAFWILHHHERYDGKGYPEGLRAGGIPLESRIIAVADAYEAMIDTRPYRAAMSVDQALAELREHAGSQFDGGCVNALFDVVRDATTETSANLPLVREPLHAVADLTADVKAA